MIYFHGLNAKEVLFLSVFRFHSFTFTSLFLFCLCLGVPTLSAQPQPDSSLHVMQIRVVGNKAVSTSSIRSILQTRTNREFLNIPNIRLWYWLWLLSNKIGEAPYPLVRETIGKDIDRIKTYYESVGYLDANIDTTVIRYNTTDVEVSFLIDEGQPSTIRTVAYKGLHVFENAEKRMQFLSKGSFVGKSITDSLFESGKRFSYDLVNRERNRILDDLRNRGYASVNKDSISFLIKRDTKEKTNLDILISVKNGPIYRFGDVNIVVTGPEGQTDYSQTLTLQDSEHTLDSAKIEIKKAPSSSTNFPILYNQLKFKPGTNFNNSLYLRSVNNFQNLGIANIRRFSLSYEGGLPDYSKSELPVFIDLQTIPQNSMNFNVFGFQRYGFGAGLGVTYLNNNLFGSAEKLEIGIKGSFEYARLDRTQKLLLSSEATISYAVPGLNFPFSGLDKTQAFENSRTIYLFRAAQINQFNYDIKANFGFNMKYEVNHTNRLSSVLDFIELDLVDAEATNDFVNQLNNNQNLTQLQRDLILQDFKPQINSQIRYTLRNLNTDILKHNSGSYLESSIELGGSLPYLADRFIFDAPNINQSLPSFGKSRLQYDQFIKLTFDFRRYIPINDESVLMYRGFAGYALPFGFSNSIPLTRRFFAGGASDIRGWAVATLGPGPIQDNTSQTNGGEIKLAAFVEFRQDLFKNVLSAKWELAFFMDAGNIWNGINNPNTQTQLRFNRLLQETALGTGMGIRIDWSYVVLRIDAAMRAHEPVRPGFYNDKSLYWSFGIGHSF